MNITTILDSPDCLLGWTTCVVFAVIIATGGVCAVYALIWATLTNLPFRKKTKS
jgi:hypothetical protein